MNDAPEVADTPAVRGRVLWIVNQYAGSPTHGMEFRHYELGRELTRLGMTVVIVSGSYSHLFAVQPRAPGAYTVERIDGLTYCWVRVPPYERATSVGRVRNMLAFMARLFRLPHDRLPRPDVVIVSSPSPFPILPAERWRRRFGCPIVFEVRDLWPLSLVELTGMGPRHPLVALLGWFEARAYRTADRVVSLLPAAGPYLVGRGMAPSKLGLVPNGVPTALLAASASPAPVAGGRGHRDPASATTPEAPAGDPAGPFIVGFLGTLGIANAIEPLIDAAALLRDEPVEVRIVGRGPQEAELRRRAAGNPKVRFLGPVAREQVPTVLRGFDAGYVGFHRSRLYRYGIAPNKLAEYMAAECPVILAVESGNDIVAEAGAGLTVAPDDPRAIAIAILRLRDMHATDRARLGANGRAYVASTLAYPALAGRYAAILAEAIG